MVEKDIMTIQNKDYEIGSIQVKDNDYIGEVQDYRCPSCGNYSVIVDTSDKDSESNGKPGHETCLHNCGPLSLSRLLAIGG